MTKSHLAMFVLGLLLPAVVSAQPAQHKIGQKPEPGVEAMTTVGSPIIERYDMVAVSAPRLRDDLQVSLSIQGIIRIPSQSTFVVERVNPLKACTIAEDTYIDRFVGPRGSACLIDTDMDGKFDKATASSVLFTTKQIKPPVPYDVIDTPADPDSSYARQTLTFLGAAGGVLHVSYREFSHDMARPAFTEELSFPLGGTFPQTITWRDTKITLLALNSEGLRFRIEPAK